MNRRQKIIVSVTGIFLVLLILVGLTYAYFLTQIEGNPNTKSISVTTANLKLVYLDGNGILETGKLEPSNDYITFLDGEGNEHSSKIFTVTNNGNATVEGYKVYLESVQNGLERKDDLVYTLTCKSYINYDKASKAISGECTGVNTETTFPSIITSIISNDIAVGVTHEYELKAKYKEMNVDQSVDMNKVISAKINIADAKTKFLAREIMDNALATPATNKTLYIEPTLQDGTNYTIPAHSTSLENERILTYTMDDYGTSYYYRGNVLDNYVNYAGMCWRVVRIEGDGSVKLILEDATYECNNPSFIGDWTIGKSTFGYDIDVYGNYVLNYLNPTNTGMSLVFKEYQTTLAQKINPDIKNPTSEQINNILSTKLKSGNWCLDDSVYTDKIGTIPIIDLSTYYSGHKNFYYGAYIRVYEKKQVSLKCNGTSMNNFNDNQDESTPMYIATLTIDEIVYAGAYLNEENYDYYLMNEYSSYRYNEDTGEKNIGLDWWTMSPSKFQVQSLSLFVIDWDGSLVNGTNSDGFYFRPAVSLASGIMIREGEGTLRNPYVIE